MSVLPAEIASGPLAGLAEAHRLLSLARTVDEVKAIRDKAEALRLYAKKAQKGLELQNECAALKLDAERKAGQMLSESVPHQGGRPTTNATTMGALGITHNQSSRWQRVASLPDDEYERYKDETRAAAWTFTQPEKSYAPLVQS